MVRWYNKKHWFDMENLLLWCNCVLLRRSDIQLLRVCFCTALHWWAQLSVIRQTLGKTALCQTDHVKLFTSGIKTLNKRELFFRAYHKNAVADPYFFICITTIWYCNFLTKINPGRMFTEMNLPQASLCKLIFTSYRQNWNQYMPGSE